MAPKEYSAKDFEDYALEHCRDEYVWLTHSFTYSFKSTTHGNKIIDVLSIAHSRAGPTKAPWPVCVLPKYNALQYFEPLYNRLVETSDELLPEQGDTGFGDAYPPFAYIIYEKHAGEIISQVDRRVKNANLKFFVEWVYLFEGRMGSIRADGERDVLGKFAELCKLIRRKYLEKEALGPVTAHSSDTLDPVTLAEAISNIVSATEGGDEGVDVEDDDALGASADDTSPPHSPSPSYSPTSPQYSPLPFSPTSPAHSPAQPTWSPTSPAHSTSPPAHSTTSPAWSPTSPTHFPNTPQ